jgi:hypothetical protein
MQSAVRQYFERLGTALSVLLNVILGGPSNQTFSARNWGWKRDNRKNLVYFIDKMWYKDPNHCMTAWVYWRVRRDVRHELESHMMKKELNESFRYGEGYPH